MLGIIPTKSKVYEVAGYLSDKDLKVGELYADQSDGRIYIYLLSETRSGPNTDFFPVYNGKDLIISKLSNKLYLSKDLLQLDLKSMSNKLTPDTMASVEYRQKIALNNKELKFVIEDDDNTFTQCIKVILNMMNCTIPDLAIQTGMSEDSLTKYINQLSKISFMRNERWMIWVNDILKLTFNIEVFQGDQFLLRYSYPEDRYSVTDEKYSSIIENDDDYFKKIIKILMILNHITKEDFKNNQIDDYTINNMMTSIKSNKQISVQIFDRFISINQLSLKLNIFKDGKEILSFGKF